MQLLLIFILLLLPVHAKLLNSFDQNKAQYGEPIKLEPFPSKTGYTGYAVYSINKDWKLKAFFTSNKVRTEHLVPHENANAKLSRNEVRDWAMKMFAPANRGRYRTKLSQHRVEGHFFDKGLIAYEYLIVNRSQGYQGVKVLIYEGDKDFGKINPKAYL